jgi:hypothetical protein
MNDERLRSVLPTLPRKELVEEVCLQFSVDVENWDIEAIEELLACVADDALRAYLRAHLSKGEK